MAYFQGTVRSAVLQLDTKINVVLPYDYYDADGKPGKYNKVLYLLHGLKQNADAWPRYSGAERFANYYGYAIVFPEVGRLWYADLPEGTRYFTYLTEELPQIVHDLFKLPMGRENTFVGGLSMGGYGALKCALRCPDKFAGAMCFSSGFYALNRPEWLQKIYHPRGELVSIMGEELKVRDEDNIDAMIRSFPKDAEKPRLYLACGTEDPLFDHSVIARDTLRDNGFTVEWEQWPGGHDWTFWDAALDKGMKRFAEK